MRFDRLLKNTLNKYDKLKPKHQSFLAQIIKWDVANNVEYHQFLPEEDNFSYVKKSAIFSLILPIFPFLLGNLSKLFFDKNLFPVDWAYDGSVYRPFFLISGLILCFVFYFLKFKVFNRIPLQTFFSKFQDLK